MAELNDKLITYGNLSTFYDKLQEQGLGGNAIEEVSELPNASENKNKLFRLDNGEKDVYAAKLIGSETITTNRLPDVQQIDKAYIYSEYDIYKYYGEYTVRCTNGDAIMYLWVDYYGNDEFAALLSTDNAVAVNSSSLVFVFGYDDYEPFVTIDKTNKIITIQDTIENVTPSSILSEIDYIPIPATYNAPESIQIGNAYLNDGDYCYYNGVEYTLNFSDDVSIKAYGWVYEGDTYPIFYTQKKASEIYYQDIYREQIIVGKYTDAVGYFIDTSEYPIVNNTITLDYPFSDAEDGMVDWQILYIPQLNAPDSEQVGVAKIYDNRNDAYYVCTESVNIYCSDDVEVPAYLWVAENTNPNPVEWSNIMSNAPSTCYSSVPSGLICNEDLYYYYDNERWVSIEDSSYVINFLGTKINHGSEGQYEYKDLVKYQRTETTEEWDWQRVVTEDAINIFNESTFTGATLTVDGSQPSIVASGSTTIAWDDLAPSIPSGKTVEVSVVVINTGNSALTPTMSGNVQMMGDGNITIQPLELGLYKAKYISTVDVWLVEAVNQEVSGTTE